MLGSINAKENFTIRTDDSIVLLDQLLQRMNQLPVNAEEREVIERIHEQMEIFNIQMGMSRTAQRDIGFRHRSKKL